jgi:hypothetical protein
MEPTEEPAIDFLETAANQPRAIRVWWYPGDLTGHEFVYPKEQAIRLARSSSSSVLTTETGTDTESMKTADLSRVDASGAMTAEGGTSSTETAEATTGTSTQASDSDTQTATTAAGSETERETVGTSGQQESDTTASVGTMGEQESDTRGSRPVRRTLPKTASSLELFGLIGLFSCAAAASLRMFGAVRR